MTDTDAMVRVVATDDGLLLFGAEDDLRAVDDAPEGNARPLSKKMVAKAGPALFAVAEFQENSGRYLKVTKESADFMRKNGVTDVASGVIRAKDIPGMLGNPGRIMKHIGVEKAGLLTPAAPAAAAAMATQAAIEMALAEIQDYLALMDAKLDRLLAQPRVQMRGDLGGVALALDEAERIHETTGTISSVTFGKIQANTLELQTAQAHCLAQLDEIAREVRKAKGDTDKLADTMRSAMQDIPFWLRSLAMAISLHDRQYVLELARVAQAEPADLESHRLGIRHARADRTDKISAALMSILTAFQESGMLGNLSRVIHFGDAKRIHRAAEEVREAIEGFAVHTELDAVEATALELVPWRDAARGVVDEAAAGAKSAGTGVAERLGGLNERIQERRLTGLQRKAARLAERLEKSGDAAAGELED